MDLKLFSYNSYGFDFEKANFISFLFKSLDIDIFVLQEHLYLRRMFIKLKKNLIISLLNLLLFQQLNLVIQLTPVALLGVLVFFGVNLSIIVSML